MDHPHFPQYPATDFDRIFHPRRIAIIGVSTEDGGGGFGSGMLRAITSMGFEGEIIPVNPKGGRILNRTIYERIEDIPGPIDFAVIAVSAKYVPAALTACLQKGVAGVEILSSGFRELGTEEGRALEEQIRAIAARGIRVVGPNCFGIYCPKSGLTLLPGPDLSRESGPVAFVSQSGGHAIDLAHTGKWMGIRFSKVISFGNGADLREAELLHYLASDDETHVIGMYIEGVADGRAFFREMAAATRRKPVIVLKGGLSEAGQKAVASHTASLGGSAILWSSVLRQVNAVEVSDMEELAHAALAFSHLPAGTYKNLSLIGGGGALGVAACDAAERVGMTIPALKADHAQDILKLLPRPGSSALNPIDVANPFVPPAVLKEVLLNAAKDERIELQILVSLLYHYKAMAHALKMPVAQVAPYKELARAVSEAAAQTGKPIVVVTPNPKRGLDDLDVIEMMITARREFLNSGIAVYDELHDAIRAIAHVGRYYETQKAMAAIERPSA